MLLSIGIREITLEEMLQSELENRLLSEVSEIWRRLMKLHLG